jgi:hypothetical protein
VAAALSGAVEGGMRVTAILRAAYHSAFRGGDDRALGEEEFRQLDAIRKFLLVIGDGGQDGQFSPLHHTIYCAYLRHKVATDDLAGIDLDQPFTRCLSALAGMSYEAARNSLAKAGVSTVREKLSHGEIVAWLEKRRDFPPLREGERRVSTPPWRRSRCCPPSLCRPVLRRSAATIWPRRAMPMRYAAPRTRSPRPSAGSAMCPVMFCAVMRKVLICALTVLSMLSARCISLVMRRRKTRRAILAFAIHGFDDLSFSCSYR